MPHSICRNVLRQISCGKFVCRKKIAAKPYIITYLKELRLSLALKQKEFADVLKLSRTAYSMAEAEHRELTAKESMQLNEFERALHFSKYDHTIEDLVPEIEANRAKCQAAIAKHKENAKAEYVNLCDILEEIKSTYEKAAESLFDIRRLLKVYPNPNSKHHKYFLSSEDIFLRRMEMNDPEKQYLFEMKIKAYKND